MQAYEHPTLPRAARFVRSRCCLWDGPGYRGSCRNSWGEDGGDCCRGNRIHSGRDLRKPLGSQLVRLRRGPRVDVHDHDVRAVSSSHAPWRASTFIITENVSYRVQAKSARAAELGGAHGEAYVRTCCTSAVASLRSPETHPVRIIVLIRAIRPSCPVRDRQISERLAIVIMIMAVGTHQLPATATTAVTPKQGGREYR